MIVITKDELKLSYLQYLQAENSAINAFAENTYWDIIAGAESSTFLDLYYNLNLVSNSIYIQNSAGDQCDQILYELGLPARGQQTYGSIGVTVTSSVPVTIPAFTVFEDAVTGNQYQTLQELTVPDDLTTIFLYAINPGNNYIEPIGATLSYNTINVRVTSSTNGQQEESDQSCIERALRAKRVPPGGSRSTDYEIFALQANATLPTGQDLVTAAYSIRGYEIINTVNILGLFILSGTNITEYQLNQGLLTATTFVGYSRQTSTDTITDVNNYIQAQRLVGLPIIVGTSYTYPVLAPDNLLNIIVSLITGYDLTTIINVESQDVDGNPITVELTVQQLIQREARRAICNQPFGGTNIGGQNYITINSIVDVLNTQLSSTNGQLAKILTNITITNSDFAVPNQDYSVAEIFYTYDITTTDMYNGYDNIVVSLP